MKSKNEAQIARKAQVTKSKSPIGGKVLQRLFAYLGQRDPNLNSDVVATVAVPVAARPRSGLTAMAMRAGPLTVAKVRRKRSPSSAAKSFATAIIAAATAIKRSPRKKAAAARAAAPKRGGAAPAPAAPATGWQAIGPSLIPNGQTYGTNRVDVIGRVASIAIDPSNPKHILLGAAGGGIWESPDSGGTWAPRSDFLPSLAIGAIAFDPSAPKKVYAGSGEGNFYANLGAGVYRSIDGGTTWSVLASAPFVGSGFYALVVDKTPTILYAATTNGFYKSTNSGASWTVKRAVKCWGISVHPNGGMTEILATFADGLFVSTNGGTTFTPVALPSVPSGTWVRLAVDRSVISPDVAYVFGAVSSSAHLWRRAGTTWTKITALPTVPALNVNQAWYDWYVAAPPDNTKQVFIGAIDAYRGTLGTGWTWQCISTQGAKSIHPDQHCLSFSPGNSKIIYAGNDGGIYRSVDSGANWTAINKGLGISELEYLGSDPTTWKWLMAGTQDNGTIRFTGNMVWDHIADGDGGDCGVNQSNPNIVYHSYYSVTLERSTNKGNTWTPLNPPSVPSLFYPPNEVANLTVAIGGASLVVTRTGVAPWTTVPLGLAAGELPSAMRAIDPNTILIGTSAGRMLRMSWNGASWVKTMLASPSAPRYISCIAVDPSNTSRYWVTVSRIGGGTVYRSDTAGSAWVNCTTGLPNIPMNSVVVDPANFKRVFVSADVGVYQSLTNGASWTSFSTALPNAMAVDLILHKKDRMLICATRNRGAWAIPVP
jgi:hypothetical protein